MLQEPMTRPPSNGSVRIDADIAPPWNVSRRGKSLVYRGQFAVFDRSGIPVVRVAGQVVEWPGLPAEVYLFNPPKEFRLHPHGRCLQLLQPNDRWYRMHFEKPARTFDQARAYIEQVLSEAAAPPAPTRIVEAPRIAPSRMDAPTAPNTPTLQYARRHHWIWLARRLQPLASLAVIIGIGFITVQVLQAFEAPFHFYRPPLLLLFAFALRPGIRLVLVFIDWYRRSIRLYSDGRLDYSEGIRSRHCTSVSTRFGAIHFHYRNEMAMLLDCADIELPFNGGTIEAIPGFRRFWEISQGRA